jgi:uncharacterized protein (DUF2141 family)
MKLFARIALLLFLSCGSSRAAELTVVVQGLNSTNGILRAALFESAKGFPMDATRALAHQSLNLTSLPKGHPATFVFKSLPEKDYAVSLHHDEDADGKLKTSWLGKPREGIGTSNTITLGMGPPEFKKSSFMLTGDLTIHVTMLYPH